MILQKFIMTAENSGRICYEGTVIALFFMYCMLQAIVFTIELRDLNQLLCSHHLDFCDASINRGINCINIYESSENVLGQTVNIMQKELGN